MSSKYLNLFGHSEVIPKIPELDLVIVYHGGCVDGEAARALLLETYPGATSIGFQPYDGPDFSHLRGKYVIMVDITFSIVTMSQLYSCAKKLLVIDHHPTGLHNCSKLPENCYYISNDYSGAMLAWRWINASREKADNKLDWIGAPFEPPTTGSAPVALQLIDVRDRLGPGASNAANALHALMFQNIDKIGELLCKDPDVLVSRGLDLLEHTEYLAKSLLDNVRLLYISIAERRYKVAAINSPIFGSELGAMMMQHYGEEVDFCYTWYETAAGRYRASLRSTDEHENVCKIATMFGGGGHRNAAGCVVDRPTLTDVFEYI